jgi:hypothetical protein
MTGAEMERNDSVRKERCPGGIALRGLRVVGWGVVGLALAAVFALIFGFVVKWIWNMLMPDLFGLKEITYWHAFGMVILAKLIFGGFGPHRDNHWRRDRKSFHDWPARWRRFADDEGWLKGKFDNWRYYDQYWRNEGKASFDAYVERMEREKREGSREPLQGK